MTGRCHLCLFEYLQKVSNNLREIVTYVELLDFTKACPSGRWRVLRRAPIHYTPETLDEEETLPDNFIFIPNSFPNYPCEKHSQKREIIHCFHLLSNSSSYSKSPQVHQSFIFDHFNHLRWLWKTLSLWGKSGKGKTVQNCTSPFCPVIQFLLKAPALVCYSDFCWEY